MEPNVDPNPEHSGEWPQREVYKAIVDGLVEKAQSFEGGIADLKDRIVALEARSESAPIAQPEPVAGNWPPDEFQNEPAVNVGPTATRNVSEKTISCAIGIAATLFHFFASLVYAFKYSFEAGADTLFFIPLTAIAVTLISYYLLIPLFSVFSKILKPLFTRVSYPFIGLWVVGRWIVKLVSILVLKSFFWHTFFRRYCDSVNHNESCECVKCNFFLIIAPLAWILEIAAALVLTIFMAASSLPWIVGFIFLATNVFSIFYELGRWSYNKRATQTTQEKPNPIV